MSNTHCSTHTGFSQFHCQQYRRLMFRLIYHFISSIDFVICLSPSYVDRRVVWWRYGVLFIHCMDIYFARLACMPGAGLNVLQICFFIF